MTLIAVMTTTLLLSEIKAHLSKIVDRIEQGHDRVVLTRNGRPAAIVEFMLGTLVEAPARVGHPL